VSEDNQTIRFPVAEEFHSIQGEGRWTGTPMHFVRLAGCCVGDPGVLGDFPMLKTGRTAWGCHTYDGRSFVCDTDFNLRKWMEFEEILDDTKESHICLTGGEPLIHGDKILDFIEKAGGHDICVHVETSGTIAMDFPHMNVWLTVSPKHGALGYMISQADEVKLLVDKNFDLSKLPPAVLHHPLVYVQPINEELSVNKANVQRCFDILNANPHWNLSVQLHKFIGVR
jgi:7-carboxy-7-deazaguanine synthase